MFKNENQILPGYPSKQNVTKTWQRDSIPVHGSWSWTCHACWKSFVWCIQVHRVWTTYLFGIQKPNSKTGPNLIIFFQYYNFSSSWKARCPAHQRRGSCTNHKVWTALYFGVLLSQPKSYLLCCVSCIHFSIKIFLHIICPLNIVQNSKKVMKINPCFCVCFSIGNFYSEAYFLYQSVPKVYFNKFNNSIHKNAEMWWGFLTLIWDSFVEVLVKFYMYIPKLESNLFKCTQIWQVF